MSGLTPRAGLEFRVERYDSPCAQQLIDAVQAEYTERYGGPDDTPVDPNEFAAPDGLFMVGYLDNVPVAMGGVRRHPATGDDPAVREVEIKRMYVVPDARGNGLSRVMLAELEDRARQLGANRVVLETGLKQPEAISLYETSGYQSIDGFGHYRDAPLSRSFAKEL